MSDLLETTLHYTQPSLNLLLENTALFLTNGTDFLEIAPPPFGLIRSYEKGSKNYFFSEFWWFYVFGNDPVEVHSRISTLSYIALVFRTIVAETPPFHKCIGRLSSFTYSLEGNITL